MLFQKHLSRRPDDQMDAKLTKNVRYWQAQLHLHVHHAYTLSLYDRSLLYHTSVDSRVQPAKECADWSE